MNNTAVKLENIIKVFPLETEEKKFNIALENVSLEILKGSFTVIGGANGSGKSVLMNIIAGLEKASDGKVSVLSKPGLIFQDAATQILGDTPRDDVAVGPRNLKVNKKEIPDIVEKSLKAVNLFEKADYPAEFLSGGEKRRLAVAAILAMNRDIIIFDEPYANLDYPGVKDVNALLKQLKNEGKTVILLTHELEKCLGMSDHFIVLNKGKIVFDGKAENALKLNMEEWGIRNPLCSYSNIKDMVW